MALMASPARVPAGISWACIEGMGADAAHLFIIYDIELYEQEYGHARQNIGEYLY